MYLEPEQRPLPTLKETKERAAVALLWAAYTGRFDHAFVAQDNHSAIWYGYGTKEPVLDRMAEFLFWRGVLPPGR